MHRKLITLLTVITFAMTAALWNDAFATDKNQAMQACSKNPKCTANPGKDGVNLKVGWAEVFCPNEGQCVCLLCKGSKPAPGRGSDVRGALSGNAAGTTATARTKTGSGLQAAPIRGTPSKNIPPAFIKRGSSVASDVEAAQPRAVRNFGSPAPSGGALSPKPGGALQKAPPGGTATFRRP